VDEGTLRCELAHGGKGVLSRESVVHHSPLFIAAEIREVQMKGGELNTLLSLASSICKEWLIELYPDEFKSTVQVQFQPSLKCIVAERQERFRNITLSSERIDPPPVEESARVLAEDIIQGKIPLKSWDHTLDQWIIRLNNLVRWCPEFELPPLTDEDRRHLIEQFCHGAFSVKELKNRSIKSLVKSWLSDTQKDLLNQQAPERLKLANNRNPKVTYVDAESPYISLRIQEIYDVNETPRIAMNRIPVLMHILAPNMREVQITQDLARFWTDHYPKLKQQLQRRYPKHEWR
jgi:ATP-dependent helicase HrpB